MAAVAEAVIDAAPQDAEPEDVVYALHPERLAIPPPPAIFAALAAIMRETTAIAKDRTNTQQGFKYRGIDDVYNSIHASFARHGVFTTSHILERVREDRATRSGGSLVMTQLHIEYTFHCCADGSTVRTEVWGEGMDSADKSSNKALSVAHKYALLQMLLIPTDDPKDPDADAPPPTTPPVRTQAPEPPPEPPPEDLIAHAKEALHRAALSGRLEDLMKVWKEIPNGDAKREVLKPLLDGTYKPLCARAKNKLRIEAMVQQFRLDRETVKAKVKELTGAEHFIDIALEDADDVLAAIRHLGQAQAPAAAPAPVGG